MLHSTIENDYVTVKFDNGNVVVKTEQHHRVLLQVFVCEIHKDMINIHIIGFTWYMMKKGLYVLVIIIFDFFSHHNQ